MSGMRRVFVLGCVVLALILGAAGSASPEIPYKVNYQGRLTERGTGGPLAGSYGMTFRFYNDPSAGSLLWSEAQTLSVDSSGIFSTILGSITPIDLSFDDPVWLEVEVEGEVLWPRREIVSVPFAFRAETADRADHASDADSLGGHTAGDYVREGETSVITSEMIVDGTGSGLDADMVDGLHADAFADTGHVHTGYVMEGEIGSVTGEMIADGEITDDDIAPGAGIDPTKVLGGAWTSANDGPGSGLDADMVDGQSAEAFSEATHDHNDLYFTKEYLQTPGSVNGSENPVAWSKLKGVPGGFADGIDDIGTASGDGHSLDAADGNPVDVVYVDNDGRVGVGMTTPWAELDVSTSLRVYDDYISTLFLESGDPNGTSWRLSSTFNGSFHIDDFGAGPYNRFAIDENGNVGIGTVQPQRLLHLWGDNPRLLIEAQTSNAEVIFKQTGDAGSDIWALYKDNSTGDLRFFQNGDRVTLEAATGNVGVGTVNPTARLHANASAGTGVLGRSDTGDGTVGWTGASDKSGLYGHSTVGYGVTGRSTNNFGVAAIGGGDASGYDDMGDLLLGGTYGEVFCFGTLLNIYSDGSILMFLDHNDNQMHDSFSIFEGGGALVFEVDEEGDVAITGDVEIGTIPYTGYRLSLGGNAYATGGWHQPSDLRYAQGVATIENALGKVLSLRGVTFRWKTQEYKDLGFPQGEHYGIMGQEAEEVVGELVAGGPDGPKTIVYSELVPILVEAIKTQQGQIEALQKQMEEMRAQLNSR